MGRSMGVGEWEIWRGSRIVHGLKACVTGKMTEAGGRVVCVQLANINFCRCWLLQWARLAGCLHFI